MHSLATILAKTLQRSVLFGGEERNEINPLLFFDPVWLDIIKHNIVLVLGYSNLILYPVGVRPL